VGTVTRSYPLLALLEMRRGDVERHERALADAIASREEAERGFERARRRVLQEKERLDAHQAGTFRLLEAGVMDVSELSLAAGHRLGIESGLLQALENSEEARELRDALQSKERAAREGLATALAAHEAVVRHQAEFAREQASRAEARLEEEAADVHLARTMGSRSRGARS
jgi:hypothetical protein